ncbi:MAG: hypothetical protein ABI891_15155 [Acidobacteriota bacterium]
MFCQNCGKAEQTPNSYCRHCGKFLPDFDKLEKREISPEEHLRANSILNIMTAVVSLTLAILLYINFLGEENTPVLIYVTAGFLTAMFAWQAQIFIRNLKLKKQIILPKRNETERKEIKSSANDLLNEADFSDNIPASIGEYTTKNLREKVKRSS